MVVARWRRFRHAARWNGQAHHRATGVASTRARTIHPSNWSAEIIDSAITGGASTTATTSRVSSGSRPACPPGARRPTALGAAAPAAAREGEPPSAGARAADEAGAPGSRDARPGEAEAPGLVVRNATAAEAGAEGVGAGAGGGDGAW